MEIPRQAKQAQAVVEGVLGDSIIGIYLFGSALAVSPARGVCLR